MRFGPWFQGRTGRTPQHAAPHFRRLHAERLEDRRLLSGMVTGIEWNDLNGDGHQNNGEPRLGGVQIYADRDLDGTLDPGESYAYTLSDGSYQLTLTPGTYTIREVVPSDPWDWVQTFPQDGGSYTVTVLSGRTVTGCDFGSHLPTSTICGAKWNDLDNDRVRDPGEPGLGGVQIYVDANNDGLCGTGEQTVFTASDGAYSFALEPGTYTIRETVPEGWTQTAPDDGYYTVTTTDGTTVSGCDFGNSGGIKVTGVKWEDLDRDGLRDTGEAGLGGWQIYADLDDNGQYDSGEPAAFTASDGVFQLYLDANVTYTIRETLKDGWLQTAPANGYNTANGTSGATITDCNFGNVYQVMKVTGVKFEDRDYSGGRGTGEAGLGGRQIYADLNNDGQCGAGEPYVFTQSDGTYALFLDASASAPASYTIRETQQDGWLQTTPLNGHQVTTIAGSVASGCDFGNAYQVMKVTGVKFEDLNQNTLHDAGEAGLGGWQIYADLNNDGQCGAGEPYVFTHSDGAYALFLDASASAPASYTIRETQQDGWLQTTPLNGHQVTTIAGSVASGCDFGNVYQVMKVTGVKWEDLDHDGVRDTGEAGLGGRQIYADLNNDGQCGAGEPYVFTQSDGTYALFLDASASAPASYTIRETQQDGWLQTTPLNGHQVTTIASSVASGCDFGNVYQVMRVTGVKWEDLDHDGVRDTGEAGLGGWQIYADLNNDGQCGTGEPYVFTQSDGTYEFFLDASADAPSSYAIRETPKDGWLQTCPTTIYHTVPTTAGVTQPGYNFGNVYQVMKVTGVKFEDRDYSTTRNDGETGLGGWQIYADLNNDGQCGAGEPYVFTQSDGTYALFLDASASAPASYNIRETLKDGWLQTTPLNGHQVTTIAGSVASGCDFGNVYQVMKVTGMKWEDLNQDTLLGTGEAGLGGWQIYADLNNDGQCGAGEPYVFTQSDGTYALFLDASASAPASYNIRETLKDGWLQTYPTTIYHTIQTAAGVTRPDYNFGNAWSPPRVCGVKWNDLDGNGGHDANEPGLGGVQIYADLNEDGQCGAGEPYVFTQSDGTYTLELDAPGGYFIREVVPEGWHQTYPPSGVHSVNLAAGNVATGCDFGNIDGLVTGFVWNDSDGDGVWDLEESGLAEWHVYADTNGNGQCDTGEPSATTAVDGSYRLVLSDGTYTLRETVPDGWTQTAPADGAYTLTLYTGLTMTGCNFGNQPAVIDPSTPGLYDPNTSTWYLSNSTSSGVADLMFGFGPADAGWQPVVGDWDGDGIETVGLYDPDTSTWYLRNSNTTGTADVVFGYGVPASGWIAVAGDWNGDGLTTVGLYDPATATWYLRNSNRAGTAETAFGYGPPDAAWTPIVGDWDGDGRTTIGLYDATTAAWYLRNSNLAGTAELTFGYGQPGADWFLVVGDWDAAHGDSIGLVDVDCQWALRNTNSTGAAELMFGFGAAGAGWIPLAGRWGMRGAALMAAAPAANGTADMALLALDQFQPLVTAAVARYAAAGLEATRLAALDAVHGVGTDLSGDLLGWAMGNTIYLDLNAAGHGWFVDPTPSRDEEIIALGSGTLRRVDPAAVDQIDLLTVIEHELGHMVGLTDLTEAEHLMIGSLSGGV